VSARLIDYEDSLVIFHKIAAEDQLGRAPTGADLHEIDQLVRDLKARVAAYSIELLEEPPTFLEREI
jgi:hypothetical protein